MNLTAIREHARAILALTELAREPYAFPIAAIDGKLLKVATPHKGEVELELWAEPIRAACQRFEINTIRRVAAFLTTLAHEGGFKIGARENMNFSATRLVEVWPTRFNAFSAAEFAGKPEDIANMVYADRMGNGPPESGDGWRFRGNGPIQLTGRDNHQAFANAMGMSLDEAVVWIGTIEGGVMAAAWFWDVNLINVLADTPGISDETRRINGGLIGLQQRTAIFDRLVAALLKRERT